ncbi:methionine adenosyltransferase [Candidatus Pacearchaeota archaeon]|nr:methionine adenosyltransferase [Candidatus Pacearchaeota archaeon]MBD3282690.1 methionine adenosyltransferase [Candidatus Pacearchaeota archaeon]
MKKYVITSESVTEGHPDKICDQICDAILDNLIAQDPDSRAGVECMITTGSVFITGEIKTRGFLDAIKITRNCLKEIGYTDVRFGISYKDAGVWTGIKEQSPDISQGITEGMGEDKEQGAGDQGMMYGYACNETEELMPLPIMLAHKLTKRLSVVRKTNIIRGLGPDGKSQVSVEYENGKPHRLTAVVIAQQHIEDISEETIKREILEKVVSPICKEYMNEQTKIHINPTGRFVIGGPEGDAGLTGRKIIVDTYGGIGRHGGGAFSGKDSSKVDRSAAYMARYVAKNIVAAGLADKCEVALSYAIGVSKPTSIRVDCFGTNKIPEEKISELVYKNFNLTPRGVIESLNLKRPIYKKTAAYGHFGRNDPDFTWEKTDKANILREALTASHSYK